MDLTIFYLVATALPLLLCVCLLVWSYIIGRSHPKDVHLQYQKVIKQRHQTINLTLVFTLLLLITCMFIVDGGRMELIPTTSILLCFFAFCCFVLMSSGIMGWRYHRRLYVWVFLNQIPVAMLATNIFLLATGNYKKFFSYDDIFLQVDTAPVYIYGRVFWLALIMVCWVILVGMLVRNSLVYYRHQKELTADDGFANMRIGELRIIIAWGVLFQLTLGAFFFTSFALHIFVRIALAALLAVSAVYLRKELVMIRRSDDENSLAIVIPRRLSAKIDNERNNPFYSPNVTLDEIAKLLEVSREELSDYIYHEKNTTFPSWLSDNKLVHIANQIAYTDRKITEIAISCGYNDTASLSRAFKRKYGVSPMEFREQHS